MKKVLLIGDDQSSTALLTGILEGNGFEAIAENNPHDGLHAFDNNPDLDAVICDFDDFDLNANKNGVEVLSQIKEKNPNMLCILLSSAMVNKQAFDIGARFAFRRSGAMEDRLLDALEE